MERSVLLVDEDREELVRPRRSRATGLASAELKPFDLLSRLLGGPTVEHVVAPRDDRRVSDQDYEDVFSDPGELTLSHRPFCADYGRHHLDLASRKHLFQQ